MRDLALAYDAMQGHDPEDPVCADRPAEPTLPGLDGGIGGLRIAVAGDYFKRGASPAALEAVARIAKALDATREVVIPEAARARAAAFVISTSEGAALHLDRLRTRARDFDPAVRDRLIAGAMLPASLVVKAQKFRRWYREQVLGLFQGVDAILAPATPFPAPRIGQQTMQLDGAEVPLRPNIGIFTQPISFIGLPVVAVPVPLRPLPIGVQIITAPWREDVALRIARALEKEAVAVAPRPPNREDRHGDRPAGGRRRGARCLRALRDGAGLQRYRRRSTSSSARMRAPSATASPRTSTATRRSLRSARRARPST